jgi:putative ATP-binding cassette transporter
MRAAYQAGLYREALRLLRPFWPLTLFATLMGAAGGLATSWLLSVINRGLRSTDGPNWRDGVAFIGLCALALAGGAAAGIGNSLVGQRIVAALRKDIAARILCAPIAALERIRVDRLMTTLNQDIDVFSVFTFNFSGYATAFAVMAGCIATMLYLSPTLFLVAVVAIAGGMGFSRYARGEWLRYYQGVSTAQDRLQAQYRAITDGAKELRLNRARRQAVFGGKLSGAADRIADYKIAAMRLHWLADTGSSTLFFLAIGAMVALRSYLGVDGPSITGFVIIMLYVKGPIAQVAGGLPQLVQAQVAFRRIAALMTELANPEPSLLTQPAAPPGAAIDTIELRSVRYDFGAAFQLGPIDLVLQRGETLFVVGENGSGKTTLIKLLLGLYAPSVGTILLDGQVVTPAGLDAYRQLFSAVFADYFLFEDLPDGTGDIPAQAAAYLDRLEIAHAVQIEGGAFSTTALSTGQRKRLTLIHAYLEQRPVMMFDEWAADQDPTFRRVFYTELLPDLKRRGKTLIVVSHDDRYFDAADRIIRMDAGRIAEDRKVAR